MTTPFISICIPSYNRPKELLRLLRTIDCKPEGVQIVICEDMAPKRLEVREAVAIFKGEASYAVKYIENEVNKGYDWNVRDFITQADGEYNIYMGDDDGFIPGQLQKVIDFLHGHRELGYVMRSSMTSAGELMRYYPQTTFFEPGVVAYQELFRKSVFVSGFTYKRAWAKDSMTDRFDGTLLYQLYIVAEICMNHPSAYLDIPFTQSLPGEKQFFFGSSAKEKDLYVPNKISALGSMNFVGSYPRISRFVDEKYGTHSTDFVLRDISKYSYPILAYVQARGRREMLKMARLMWKDGMGCTIHFYIYIVGLLLLGTRFCDCLIRVIKEALGRTPSL